VTRPGYELGTEHVTPAVRERIIDLRGSNKVAVQKSEDAGGGPKIYVTDAVQLDVSATAIRRAVRERRDGDWAKLVPPPVADYIRKYRLYEEA
jgi:nicotinic acid mononucleotide adenylyltransferase